MIVLGLSGWKVGYRFQQRILKDRWRLAMFGFNNNTNPERNPLQDDDGAFLVCVLSTALFWFFGLKIYNVFLEAAGANEEHLATAGMHNWTFAGYNLVLAGLFAFVSDWWNIITIFDQMHQSIFEENNLAAETYKKAYPSLDPFSKWWMERRVNWARWWLAVGWIAGPTLYIVHFQLFMAIIRNEEEDGVVGAGWGWGPINTEFLRMFVASLVACFNMVVIAQDWDFPNLDAGEVKIVATDLSEITLKWEWLRKQGELLEKIFANFTFYLSGKWVNYLGIFVAIAFDW